MKAKKWTPILHLERVENFYELVREIQRWERREKMKKIYEK